MRGNLETIVGAMFAGKTSELLKRILWAKHQNKKIIVIKQFKARNYSIHYQLVLKFVFINFSIPFSLTHLKAPPVQIGNPIFFIDI